MADDTRKKTTTKAVATVTLTIDGKSITVPKGTTVLEAALQNGIHIPTFCWHPKLKSVGACRMCYVEIEKMAKLQVSCATEAVEGMVVHTDSDNVKQGRRAIIEFILLNHPLDCPTCDKGGECDLQDLTFAHGYDDSRFDFRKSRFVDEGSTSTFDDVRIGPEIVLNRNRCILCYKCVRANKEAFGEYDLGAYERGNITQINSAPGEKVDNPFSGNLVEICPVGALTNSDWRYKIRVWLTKTTPSLCNFTSSGTNTLFYKEDHQNKIFRTTSRRNDDIDDGWLPDVTRYGYQIVNSPDRLRVPLIKKEGKQVEATWDEALDLIHKHFTEISDKMGSVCIGGLASPSLDNKSLYAFSKFFRTVLNSNNVDFRSDYRMLPPDAETVFSRLCSRPFKIADIDDSDVVFVFGSDLLREHPNEYLRMRKACNSNNARVFVVNPYATKAADIAALEAVYKVGSDEQAINGICLAAIDDNLVSGPKAKALAEKLSPLTLPETSKACGITVDDLRILARALAESRKISFMCGEIVTRSKERETITTAVSNLNLLFGLENKGQVASLARYANSGGACKLGIQPSPAPAVKDKLKEIWGGYPECEPHNTDSMLALMKKEEVAGFFVIGANPIMLHPDRQFVREGLEKLDFLVACDLFESETTEIADVVLPLCSWAEYDGEYVNLEGRSQRAERAVKPMFESRPGCEIIKLITAKYEKSLGEDEQLTSEIQQLLDLDSALPLPTEFMAVKAVVEDKQDEGFEIPLFVTDDPHHCGHLTEKSPSLTSFADDAYLEIGPDLAERLKLKEGDNVRVESPVGKVIVPARISEHIENDVVLIPRNFSSTPITSLLMRKKRIDRVTLSKVDS